MLHEMANIKQVAQYAGVSPSCVSKYLRDENSVREENRERIKRAIAALNYVPSNIARSLRQGKSMTVKAIMPSITLPFFAEIFEYLRVPLHSAGYNLILQTIPPNGKFTPHDFLLADGVIISFPDQHDLICQLAGLLQTLGKPLVAMHENSPIEGIGSVIVDIRDGMSKAALYMKNNGRKSIAYVGGSEDSGTSRERFCGYMGVVPPKMRYGVFRRDFSMEWGYTAAGNMLDSGVIPDGILCENDGIAAGVIKYMLTHGVSVPDDVWVFGFDDIPLSKMYTPSISSVAIPSKGMSQTAVEILLDAMNGGALQDMQFKCSLMLRESTR